MRLAVALLVSTAAAAAPPDAATARAKELFEHAEALYALTKYDQALAEYEKAFETKPLPGFLFNIGQCHRNLGHHDKAVYFYRTYLERAPAAKNRAVVESLIAEEGQRAQQAPPPTAVAPAPAAEEVAAKSAAPVLADGPADHPPPLYRRWYLWAGAAAVVFVALLVGLGVGVSAAAPPHGTLSTLDAR